MCYPQIPAIENSSEDVFDLLILETEREETENAIRIANANFNNVFLQGIIEPLPIPAQEPPFEYAQNTFEYAQNTFDICSTPAEYIETFTNFNAENLEFISNNFIEECEIQAILRGEY